jgi:hypothetical protein
MKKFLCTLGLGVAVWGLPGAGRLSAADIESKRVSVPFAFQVDKIWLPAGHYRVEQNIGKQMVVMVNTETGHRVQVMREPVYQPTGNTKLTFEKIGKGYKLSRVS